MSKYDVSGQVIDRRTGAGIEGLRVEAWDKDLIVDDLLGSALTRQDGVFYLRFDDTDFREFFFDRRPDIYFKVFRKERLLTNTEDSVIWNAEGRRTVVTLEVDDAAASVRFAQARKP